ncbi:MAG TPA: hypothetical protein VGI22_24875 [Xanthobacteraceae bacterium]
MNVITLRSSFEIPALADEEFLMGLRYRSAKEPDGRNDAALEIMLWARSILKADGDTVVSVARHRCGDLRCGESGTTILLMHPDRPTGTVRIAKPLEAITEPDLRAALQGLLGEKTQASQRQR